jgi:excisionase family DNA binding protein
MDHFGTSWTRWRKLKQRFGGRPVRQRPNAVRQTAISVEDTARMLGLGLSSVYNLIAHGELAAIKIGDRSLIAVETVDKFIASRPKVKAAPRRASRKRGLG